MTQEQAVAAAEESGSAVEIYRQFRGLIVSGQLGANERLPTVRQTASDLGVAPGTAAKAYKMLEQEGLVVSRTAAGTRVAESAAVLPLPVMRLARELVETASVAGSSADDVVSVLRVLWSTASASSSAPGSSRG
ncbi:GntR family transcriptional regulator [Microbacterium sp. 3J1]|uniref:GntR family transcriptional regulator n=1 Tax=Microbacterium sp. 3J1 TaxID=861269 RepID=UPI000AD7424F|nr:GntR family transcriptional regulator [Microbacterium sp. 3J1]